MNVEWRDDCKTIRDRILYLYRNNLLTDCAFVVGEGEEKKVFRAHKFMVTQVSAVFEAMFYGSVGQDTENICIPNIDPDIFQTFMNAIYSDQVVPRSFKEACILLDLATKYLIKWLKDQCLSYMAHSITPSNAATGFEVLSLFGHMELASSCWKVIQEETTQVLNSEDFTHLGKETLVRILAEDKLAVKSEGELVSAVQRWVEADLQRRGLTEETHRQSLMSEFLQNIRSKERIFFSKDPLPEDWKKQQVMAAERGDVGELRRLQAAGASIFETHGFFGWTLLHSAASEGRAGCVQWLLGQGLSPHSTTRLGCTPLHWAANTGSLETVALLLGSGADPAARRTDGVTPLHLAVNSDILKKVRLLLVSGGDPAARDCDGRTPLHIAATRGSLEVVRLLLESGADPNSMDRYGMTPLHCATNKWNVDVIDLLLEKGADPAAKDKYGRTDMRYEILLKNFIRSVEI